MMWCAPPNPSGAELLKGAPEVPRAWSAINRRWLAVKRGRLAINRRQWMFNGRRLAGTQQQSHSHSPSLIVTTRIREAMPDTPQTLSVASSPPPSHTPNAGHRHPPPPRGRP